MNGFVLKNSEFVAASPEERRKQYRFVDHFAEPYSKLRKLLVELLGNVLTEQRPGAS